jgi:hypothetical protein
MPKRRPVHRLEMEHCQHHALAHPISIVLLSKVESVITCSVSWQEVVEEVSCGSNLSRFVLTLAVVRRVTALPLPFGDVDLTIGADPDGRAIVQQIRT